MADSLSERPQHKHYRAVSIGLAVLAFCISGVALMGWIFDIEVLTGYDESKRCRVSHHGGGLRIFVTGHFGVKH